MSNDEKSTQNNLVVEVANAIPAEAWLKLVECAAELVRQLFSPITATTVGVGKLIESRFESWSQPEIALAGQTVQRANEIVNHKQINFNTKPNPKIVLDILEESRVETDPDLRELWASLLATELSENMSVHPEIPVTLKRMSASDARAFDFICNDMPICELYEMEWWFLSREILIKLGLIASSGNLSKDERLQITHFGEAFRIAVYSDLTPSRPEIIWKQYFSAGQLTRSQFVKIYRSLEDGTVQLEDCKKLCEEIELKITDTRYGMHIYSKNVKVGVARTDNELSNIVLSLINNMTEK